MFRALTTAARAPSRRIALVTPDPTMARRVSAQLARWEIVPENSAGEPLNGFGAGRFMRLLLDLALQPGSVAALAALLLVSVGRRLGLASV